MFQIPALMDIRNCPHRWLTTIEVKKSLNLPALVSKAQGIENTHQLKINAEF